MKSFRCRTQLFRVLMALFCLVQHARAQEADEEWAAYMRDQFAQISDPPSPDQLNLLVTPAATRPSGKPSSRAIAEEAWTRLSSYPNFDEMLLEAVQKKRAEWKDGGYAGSYDLFRTSVIRGLGKITDPRAVRVLGELLSDLEDTMPEDINTPPNGYCAAEVLHEMLENPPVKKKEPDLDTDMPTWQLWYQQVKAGSRSFRFKGDPQEYNLKGPVSQTTAASQAVPTAPGKTQGETVAKASSSQPWPLILACGALGAGLVVVFRARRKAAT